MIGSQQRREETIGRDGFSHAWYVYTGKRFQSVHPFIKVEGHSTKSEI